MSKATNKQATNKPAAAPAGTSAKGNKKAIAAAAAQLADETDTDETDEGETGNRRQWAREMARAAEGKGNAGRRCVQLAEALAPLVPAKGKPAVRVSFAKANELAGLRRGATGDPVASWRLAVQRMRQIFGGAEMLAAQYGFAVSVDADAGALVVENVAA